MQTKRIQLKSPEWADMQFIQWLWSDPETMKPVGGPIQLTESQAQSWFTEMIYPGSPADCYRLIFNEEDQPVGEISFHHLVSDKMTAEFNIKIASTKRGKGYAKEAMILFLDYFFNQIGGRKLIDCVALDNYAGRQALLQFGFEHDPSEKDVFKLQMTRERYNNLYAP